MIFRICFLLCTSISIDLVSTQKCQYKLDGESGKIKYPASGRSEKLPNFASKGEVVSNTCIFFKNIDKKKLTLKFKSIALNGESIKIQTIKTTRKLKWKTYKQIVGKTKKVLFSIKGFKYVKISVVKNSGTFEMEYSLTVPPVASCQKLSESVKTVKCTKGIKAGSKCSLSCAVGYTPNQYIQKSAGKKFIVTCRKISARKGVWKPALNRIVCGKGKKTKKECKKTFELCVPAIHASVDTTTTRKPNNSKPKLSVSTTEVFSASSSSSTATPRAKDKISSSKLDVTTKQISSTFSPDFNSQSSMRLSTQTSTPQTKSLASSRGTQVPRALSPESTDAQVTPTVTDESTSPTTTYRTARPTQSSTTPEPTPPPPHILFSRFPELHPDYKGHETNEQPQSTAGTNPTRHAPLVTSAVSSPSTTAHLDIHNADPSHEQSSVTQQGRGKTSPQTPIPILTRSVSDQSTSRIFKTEPSTSTTPKTNGRPHHSTSSLPTTEKLFPTSIKSSIAPKVATVSSITTEKSISTGIKSSIAPKVTTVSTTTTRKSTTQPRPPATTSTTTRKTRPQNKVPFRRLNFNVIKPSPRIRVTTTTTASTTHTEAHTPNQLSVSLGQVLVRCRRRFCELSIVTRRFARTCQSYGGRLTTACHWCRRHPASPCNTATSFP